MQQQSESRKLPITFNFLTTTFPLHRRRGIKIERICQNLYIHFTVAHNLHTYRNEFFNEKLRPAMCHSFSHRGKLESRKLAVYRFPLRYVHPWVGRCTSSLMQIFCHCQFNNKQAQQCAANDSGELPTQWRVSSVRNSRGLSICSSHQHRLFRSNYEVNKINIMHCIQRAARLFISFDCFLFIRND